MDRSELRGLAGSLLGDIDDAAFGLLLEDATIADAARGEQVLGGRVGAQCAVVLDGTVRTYLAGRDGRQLTVRYANAPAAISSSSGAERMSSLPIAIQAVSDVTVLELSLPVLLRLTATNTSVAVAMSAELARRLNDVYHAFSTTFYGSLNERLATHLLYSAELNTDAWIVSTTRQELARTLGTAREVVARLLGRMEDDGIIETSRRGIAIARPDDMVRVAGEWWTASRGIPVSASAAEGHEIDNLAQSVLSLDRQGEIVYANNAMGATF